MMESTVFEFLTSIIKTNIGPLISTPSGFSKRNCMMCSSRGHNPDKRQRFGIKIDNDSIAMNCFNCKFSAGWQPGKNLSDNFINFLQEINVSGYDIKKAQFETFKQNKSSLSSPIFVKDRLVDKWKTSIELPPESMTFKEWISHNCTDNNFLQAAQYAIERNFYDSEKLYWSPSSLQQMNRRILIPFYYNGNIVGYTGRFYKDLKNKDIPKYINNIPHNLIYNLDEQIEKNKYLIICEGVLDAMLTTGISPLGSISQDQIDLINRLDKKIIVSPDRDKTGEELVEVAINEGWGVSFPKWNRNVKDAAKAVEVYGRIATVQSIIESVEYNKVSIRVKRNLDNT